MDSFWLMISVAIAAGVSIPLLGIWTVHRKEIAKLEVEATARLSAEKAAQYAADKQQLEDRLQVLERIVTDKGYDVATQIEALRDTRRVDADLLVDRREIEEAR